MFKNNVKLENNSFGKVKQSLKGKKYEESVSIT